jgi:hypothetical protein
MSRWAVRRTPRWACSGRWAWSRWRQVNDEMSLSRGTIAHIPSKKARFARVDNHDTPAPPGWEYRLWLADRPLDTRSEP